MPAESAHDLAQLLAASRPAIERISAEVWSLAEVSFEETDSAQVHIRELEAAGFTLVSTATSGLPTAFVAEWSRGNGGAKVGFLLEYDALPRLGNAAGGARGCIQNGHGCGHNLLGAALTGAAIAAKGKMLAERMPGTLRVYGCAAEEVEGAKVFMARDGLFDDLDGALHWHPGPDAAVLNFRLAATQILRLSSMGEAPMPAWSRGADAARCTRSSSPPMGSTPCGSLEPTGRVHYVIVDGGRSANVVPDYRRMTVYVRDIDRARVQATSDWIGEIARGAALATQTTTVATAYFGMHDVLPNHPLAERMQVHLEHVGMPDWTADERVRPPNAPRGERTRPRSRVTRRRRPPRRTLLAIWSDQPLDRLGSLR